MESTRVQIQGRNLFVRKKMIDSKRANSDIKKRQKWSFLWPCVFCSIDLSILEFSQLSATVYLPIFYLLTKLVKSCLIYSAGCPTYFALNSLSLDPSQRGGQFLACCCLLQKHLRQKSRTGPPSLLPPGGQSLIDLLPFVSVVD